MITKKISITIILVLIIIGNIFSQESIYLEKIFKADAQFHYKNFEIAENLFSEAINIKNNNALIYIKRGNCFLAQRNYDKAIKDYKSAILLKNNIAIYKIARTYSLANNSVKACEYLNKYLKTKGKFSQSEIKMDTAFSNIENTKEWNNLWRNEFYSSYEKALEEAKYQMFRDKDEEALVIVNKILSKNKKRHEALEIRGDILIKFKDYKAAAKNYSEAYKIKSRNSNYIKKAGDAYFLAKKYKNALESYNTYLKQSPSDISIFHKKTLCLYKLNNLVEANNTLNLYLKYYTKDFEALLLSSKINYGLKEYFTALEKINICIENDKNNIEYYVLRGDIYSSTDNFENAKNDYAMALDLNPKMPEVYYKRGIAKIKLHDNKGACSDWQKAQRGGYHKAADYIEKHCKNNK